MPPVFDAYVIVDWSAAAQPQTGLDSIWIAASERFEEKLPSPRLSNPATRRAAIAELADLLADLVARGRRVLVGCDFAFGYPAGFAAKMSPQRPDWRGVWAAIAAAIYDGEDNANNRFAVAAEFNRRASGRAFPFWGCPSPATTATLEAKKPAGYGADGDGLAELRLTERIAPGPQPTWKLAYPGSVGGQTLLGIAHLEALRRHPWLDGTVRVWPFETGLQRLDRNEAGARIVLAEVYPSMLPTKAAVGEIRDAAQVRALAMHFARLDEDGRLGSLFAGPVGLTAEELRVIEREEGWILGIETAAPRPTKVTARYSYLHDPSAIYRQSFATIRAEANLSHLPADAESLAVRLIHAAGEIDLVGSLAIADGLVAAGRAALTSGAPVLVDVEMVARGVIRSRLPAANPVICTLGDPGVAETAEAAGVTRAAVAVERWLPYLAGALVAIGNAPTALFRLLELIDAGAPRPAAILAFPVGFAGAAESKQALIEHPAQLPYVTLRGRRGGSALAAAAVNALAGDPA